MKSLTRQNEKYHRNLLIGELIKGALLSALFGGWLWFILVECNLFGELAKLK